MAVSFFLKIGYYMFIDIAEIPMEKLGIYTLANDVVFDQLVALLNSIEKKC